MRFIIISLLISACAHARTWNNTYFDARNGVEVSRADVLKSLFDKDTVVLGEKHYTPAVQDAEAGWIHDVVVQRGAEGHFTFGWEFLSHSEQAKIDLLWDQVMQGVISSEEFLAKTQGKSGSPYISVIDKVQQLIGHVIGLNLTRAEKTPVTKNGLSGLDPKLLPPDYSRGSLGYHERFLNVMKDHVPADKLDNYYEAQCLTDDVMAYQYLQKKKGALGIVIAGAFHTDYFDGTVARLIARGDRNIGLVKIVDATDFTESELSSELSDPKYGPTADFVMFVNEPQ